MAAEHHVRSIVASNLKRIRTQRGMTQAQLAELTELSNTYIANIECGKTWISDTTLEKLSQALGVEFHVLFYEDAERRGKQALPAAIKSYLLQLQDTNSQLLSGLEKALETSL